MATRYLRELSERHHFGRRFHWSTRVAAYATPVLVAPFPQWVCLMSQEYSINQMGAAANRNVPKKINENLSTLYCFDGQSLLKITVPGLFLFGLKHIRTNLHRKGCPHAVTVHSSKCTELYSPLSFVPRTLPAEKRNLEGGTLSLWSHWLENLNAECSYNNSNSNTALTTIII